MQLNSYNLKGILSVAGGFLLHSALSSFYVWGAINIYVISYFRLTDPSINNEIGQVYLLFQVFPWIFAMFFTDYVKKKIGLRWMLVIGSLGICLCTWISAFCQNLWLFMVFFALLWNIFAGMMFMLPLNNGFEYFPNNKGLVSGIISTGFGMGPMGANTLALKLINPGNEKPDFFPLENNSYFNESIAGRVPLFFKVYAVYLLVTFILSILFISEPHHQENPEGGIIAKLEVETQRLGLLEKADKLIEAVSEKTSSQPSAIKFVFTKRFLLIFFTFFFATGYPFIIVTDFKNYSIGKLSDDEFITWVGSIGMFLNGSLRSLTGHLYDKFGFKRTYFTILFLEIFTCLTFDLVSDNKYIFLIWVCIASVCLASQFVINIPEVARNFSKQQGSKLISVLFFAVLLSQSFQGLILIFVKAVVGYKLILVFEAILAGAALLCVYAYQK
jgi:MFS transporter, OFA family, oxalate/formate antiporter